MLKKHSQLFEALFTASDLLVVSIAWTLSYWMRFSWGVFPVDKGVPPFGDYLRMLIFVWLIWAFVFRRFRLYRPMRGVNRFREVWTVAKANSLSVVLLLAVTYLFREKSAPFSRLVFVIFWFLSTGFTVSSRSLIRVFLRYMRKRGYNIRFVLVVGAGELAERVAQRIVEHPEYGLDLVGVLERGAQESAVHQSNGLPRRSRAVWEGNGPLFFESGSSEEASGFKVVGTYDDLPKLLAMGGIDQVIVALPFSDHDCMEAVIFSVGDSMVDVRIVPDFHRFIQLGAQVDEFDGLPVVGLVSTPLYGINRLIKRVLDIVLASVSLLFAVPIILVSAALVKLTSRGPIFYSQDRVGLDGRTFTIYKLRTMHVDAEAGGAKFAVRGDSRVTLVGSFLRRLNIDELPQLANVLFGTMSLVGPRPERDVFIQEFKRHVPRYMLRHKVQAGMTGWAQVNGWRGNTSIERRIEHDLYYIEHWSLALDLKILGLTIINGFRDRNAY